MGLNTRGRGRGRGFKPNFFTNNQRQFLSNGQKPFWKNNLNSKQHYCETCDKSFWSDNELLVHKSEHETCGREGCEFTAHPKIIAKHIRMQHLSGLYKRIGKLYTEEDIAKWIEERKRRYPTRKVVEEKKLLEDEKIKRGERIKDDNCKFNKSFNKRNRGDKKKNSETKINKPNKNRRPRKKHKPNVAQLCLEEEENASERMGVPAFSGIKTEMKPEEPDQNDQNNLISDDEWEAKIEPQPNKNNKLVLNNSLGLLAACYDSDEEVEDTEPIVSKTKVASADEDSGPEEVKTVTCKKPLSLEDTNKVDVKRKLPEKKGCPKRTKNFHNDSGAEKRSLTLLEKLLKNEIRHERNLILQCVHYVVTKNFFQE